MTTAPIESVFSRAWQLLSRNWVIIIPGVIVGVIVGIVGAIPSMFASASVGYDGSYHPGAAAAALSTGLIAGIVGIVGYVATQAYTVGMAGAAWERGTTSLADGTAAFQQSAANILMTALGLIVLGFIAFFLSFVTFGIAFIAFVLFTLYAMPSAIIGRHPGFSSIAESFRIATQRFVPTLIIAVLIAVISFVVGLITLPLHFIPLLGPIVAAVITQIVVAYAVLVIVGEYLALRNTVATPYAGGATPYPGGASPYSPGPSAYQPPPTSVYTPPPAGAYEPPAPSPPPPDNNI